MCSWRPAKYILMWAASMKTYLFWYKVKDSVGKLTLSDLGMSGDLAWNTFTHSDIPHCVWILIYVLGDRTVDPFFHIAGYMTCRDNLKFLYLQTMRNKTRWEKIPFHFFPNHKDMDRWSVIMSVLLFQSQVLQKWRLSRFLWNQVVKLNITKGPSHKLSHFAFIAQPKFGKLIRSYLMAKGCRICQPKPK